MNIFDRIYAAWLAFKDPALYWEGVSIRKIAQEIALKDGMAILRRDPDIDYIVEMLPYKDQQAIGNYLARL